MPFNVSRLRKGLFSPDTALVSGAARTFRCRHWRRLSERGGLGADIDVWRFAKMTLLLWTGCGVGRRHFRAREQVTRSAAFPMLDLE